MSKQINELAQLEFIDFCLLFRGHVSHSELNQKFATELPVSRRLLQAYYAQNSTDVEFHKIDVRVFQGTNFKPLFEHDVKQVIGQLTQVLSQSLENGPSIPMQASTWLNFPDIHVLARLTQAILNGNAVNVIYTSLTSGSSSRDLVPHCIVDNGLRWHLRAYDRKSETFRDFVLTRISKASIRSNQVYQHELRDVDWQWQQQVRLVIKPHPINIRQPTAIEMDYGMIDGELVVNTRAALAGYILRRWNVDCTLDAELRGPENQLWLSNLGELSEVASLSIAPGYNTKTQ